LNIYDNADDYVQAGKMASWSHGVASPKNKVIRTFPAAHGFFDSTLPHELGHIIFREFVGFKAQVPIWFEEEEVIHVMNDNAEDIYRGESKLKKLERILELYYYMTEFQRQFFQNNAVPGFVLKTDNTAQKYCFFEPKPPGRIAPTGPYRRAGS